MPLWKNPFTAADRAAATPPGVQQQQVQQDNTSTTGGTKQQQNKSGSMSVPNKSQQKQQSQAGDGQDTIDGNSDDPMLNFDSLWQNPVDKDGNEIQEDNTPKSYLPAINPEKFGQMLEKLDFTRSITPEEEEIIGKGGPESVKTLRQVMNKVNRQSFATMFNAFAKITETGFHNASDRFMSEVPNHVREMMTDNELAGSNPLLKLPAFAPMVKSIRNQYQKRFPKASPSEVTTAVNAYFDKMYQDMEGVKKGSKQKGEQRTNEELVSSGAPEADFEAWLLDEKTDLSNMAGRQ
jgi:hypothetical protein